MELGQEELKQILSKANQQDNLRKVLAPKTLYGAPLLEHAAIECGLNINTKIGELFAFYLILKKRVFFKASLKLDNDLNKIHRLVAIAREMYVRARDESPKAGYIIYRTQKKAGGDETFDEYVDFQPLLLHQVKMSIRKPRCIGYLQMEEKAASTPYKAFPMFTAAVDEYFSQRENQKIESNANKQENAAKKKLKNIEKDHEQRLAKLEVCTNALVDSKRDSFL